MTRGLTLIELVVAMAVFALVATMGLQSLTGSLTMRDRLSDIAQETEALSQATALLRNDLSSALPMFFFPPGQARPDSALKAARGNQGFGLSIGGQPGLALPTGGMDAAEKQRVDWRYDASQQRLTRRAWPTLYPAKASQQGPEIPVLDGVMGLSLRSFWAGKGWVSGLSSDSNQTSASGASGDGDQAGTVSENYSTTLPLAVEITLETTSYGQIIILEYFQ